MVYCPTVVVLWCIAQLPKDDQVLRQKLRAAARTTFLRKMNAGLMTHEELQRLWEVLEESSSPPKTGDELVSQSCSDFVCHCSDWGEWVCLGQLVWVWLE